MDQVRRAMSEGRANTDASLGAERDSTDAAFDRLASDADALLDDLIRRNRVVGDDGIAKLRENANRRIAAFRIPPPTSDSSIAGESRTADDAKCGEQDRREASPLPADSRHVGVVAPLRANYDADRPRLEARRHEVDERLSNERYSADVVASALVDAKRALASAQCEQGRRNEVFEMVSHDLRSPLCVIAINAQSIAELTKDALTREAAQDIEHAAARMGRLVTDMLDVVRIESGSFSILKSPHDVGTFMAEVFRSYVPVFAERGITLAAELPGTAAVASFDQDRIVQVLSNLFGNAIKFTPAHGAIRVQVERRPGVLEFAISDSGVGIERDALPHVFERFWQAGPTGRRGLGLGLYICKTIVEGHGGRIWVESEVGRGTTVRFTLATD